MTPAIEHKALFVKQYNSSPAEEYLQVYAEIMIAQIYVLLPCCDVKYLMHQRAYLS